jgi:hypothetical protein
MVMEFKYLVEVNVVDCGECSLGSFRAKIILPPKDVPALEIEALVARLLLDAIVEQIAEVGFVNAIISLTQGTKFIVVNNQKLTFKINYNMISVSKTDGIKEVGEITAKLVGWENLTLPGLGDNE